MDQDDFDSDISEGESSNSEGSVVDEDSSESRRMECLEDMIDLERQFSQLRNLLFQERIAQVEQQLEDVMCERASEYVGRVKLLQEEMQERLRVLEKKRQLQLQRVTNIREGENYAVETHFVNECSLAQEEELQMRSSGTRLGRLKTADDWQSDDDVKPENQRISTRTGEGQGWSSSDEFGLERRKRPVTVSGPIVVYQLKDEDIFDDLRVIRASLQRLKCGRY